MTYGAQTGRSGGRRVLPLVLAAVVGLVLVLVIRAVVSGGGDDEGGEGGGGRADGSGERTGCQSLRVTASSEKAALLSQIAADYNRSDRRVEDACVDVQVTSKASGGAAEALARGWNERVDGPRPDVWSPASSSWTALLRQRTAAQDKGDLVPAETPSIAQTPLVIAMPQPMAEALGWPAQAARLGRRPVPDPGPEGLGRQGARRVGRVQARQDQPGLLHLGAERHHRGLLRRHRPVQRPDRQGRHRPQGDRVRQAAGGLGRALRRHDAHLPGQPVRRRRGRPPR